MAGLSASNSLAPVISWSAPEAAASALALGQPSRGATILSSLRLKFAIARAAVPIFSPSCGLTRTTQGEGRGGWAFLESVPAMAFCGVTRMTRTGYRATPAIRQEGYQRHGQDQGRKPGRRARWRRDDT